MKSLKVISDPEAFQLLGDETRRKIVFLLRVKEMTVSQISAELNVTPQAVYHHIKKLQTAEMIEVTREERVGHLIESYYRTTAEVFICSVGNASSNPEFAREHGFTMIPCPIIIDSKTYLDTVVDMDEVYVRLEAKKNMPTTSTANVGEFAQFFSEVGKKAEAILHISMSSVFSGHYNTAFHRLIFCLE